MRFKKVGLGIATTAAVGSLVVGCGNSGSQESNSVGTVNVSSESVPKGQTITLWYWIGNPGLLKTVSDLAQNWASQHGDTVQVIDESKNPKGFQFFATAARTGKGPDLIFGMPDDNLGEFVQQNLLAPVPSGVMNMDSYPGVAQTAVQANGKPYGVPVTVETTVLAYNKNMIKNAPTTWSQFVQDANAHGFMYDQANLYYNYALISGYGGYVFKNANGTYDTKDVGLGNDGSVQAYSLMHDMDTKYHWMTPSVDENVARSKFMAGKIGMYITGPWDISNLQQSKIPYAFTTWPSLPNGNKPQPFAGVQTIVVNAQNKDHEQASWSLAKFLSNSTAEMKYFTDDQQIPALNTVQQSSTVQANADIKAIVDQLQNAQPMPNIPQMQAVWSAMSVIENIITGKVTPAQGAKDFLANIQKGIQVQNS